jgi:hypothetical protein
MFWRVISVRFLFSKMTELEMYCLFRDNEYAFLNDQCHKHVIGSNLLLHEMSKLHNLYGVDSKGFAQFA